MTNIDDITQEELDKLQEDIIQAYEPGDIIPHGFLRERLKCPVPGFNQRNGIDHYNKRRDEADMEYMRRMELLKEKLLKNCSVCLCACVGRGYRYVPPEDQVEYAYNRYMRKQRKLSNSTSMIIDNVQKVAGENGKQNDLRSRFAIMDYVTRINRRGSKADNLES